jgi:small subunit ribosomal protein S15
MPLQKEEKRDIIKNYAINDKDTGSVEVQVALLTHHIQQLTKHCSTHPKDASSRRGLLIMVCQRRKCLKYIGRKNQSTYETLKQRLGLRG